MKVAKDQALHRPARRRGRWRRRLRRLRGPWSILRGDARFYVGGVLVLILILTALFAPYMAPYDPADQSFDMLTPPSAEHLLGTDSYGRDMLSRILYGARIALAVGPLAVGLAAIFSSILGLVAGYYRGSWIDSLIMRGVETLWAFPALIGAIALATIIGLGLTPVLVAIFLAVVDDFAIVTRGTVMALRDEEHVLAARAIGMTDRQIITRELLPNVISPILVVGITASGLAILFESALSFVGLGLRPPTPTWGGMIREGQTYLALAPWISLSPGLAILLTVLGLNLLGDTLQDALDIRRKTRGSLLGQ